MQIMDWIVLGIIIIFALIGFCVGFVKMVFKLGKGLITYFIAYLFCKPLTKLCAKMGFYATVNGKILDWISTKGEIFSQPITDESINAVGENLKLPSFLNDLVAKALRGALGDLVGSGATLGQGVSDTLTYYIFLVICFIVLFIVALIVVSIIGHIVIKLFSLPVLNLVNRLLGLAFGAVLGVFVIGLAFIVIDFASTWIPSLCDFIEKNIEPTKETFGVARFFYNHNFVRILFNALLKSENITWTTLTGQTN